MPTSQNLLFAGVVPQDARHPEPPGWAIAQLLCEGAKAQGWMPEEPDNWRDCGWSFQCRRDIAKLEIALAPYGEERWIVQVGPAECPGLIGRMLGKMPSATPSDTLAFAKLVHEVVSRQPTVSSLRWAWDGPPNDTSDQEPLAQ